MNAEIENNIRKNVQWSQLPTHIKQVLNNSPKEYGRYIVTFSIKNQLRYKGNLVRSVLKDEKRYYERVVAYSRERLMLFPYHLADMVVKGLRITPFNYYISVLEKLVQAEKSYDTLPNFTAADCLRLLGIGRNEYIDLMNKSRSNRSRLFGRKNVRGLLPAVPRDIHIEPWWRVEVGLVLEEDIKMVNEEELSTIDSLIDYGSRPAAEINYHVVLSLYKKGLIYLDVPITAVDRVQVPPLQGFVMNRITGDYFETLLYKIFVSIDEHTTVGELAGVLLVETELVKQAVSLYCRLQFANKLDAITDHIRARMHPSWKNMPSPTNRNVDITPLTLNLSRDDSMTFNQESHSPQSEPPDSPATSTLNRQGKRVAFLYDATLTAYLMMGNLSPGLKKHAVTMFEVGKLCDESLDSFLTELEKVSVLDADGEGEARRFFDHAVILRSTILSLRKIKCPGLDLIRIESLHSLDEATCHRLLQKKYKLLVSVAPLSREVRPVVSLSPPHLGPAVPEVNSLWFKLFLYHMSGYGPPTLLLVKGQTLHQLPRIFLGYSRLLVTSWVHESAVIASSNILQINSALSVSPVLIQAYGVHQSAETYVMPFPIHSPTSTRESAKITVNSVETTLRHHPALKCLSGIVNLENNCGYLMFIKTGVRDLGCLDRDPLVRLRKTSSSSASVVSKIQKVGRSEVTSITNENFCLLNDLNSSRGSLDSANGLRLDKKDDKLDTPLESHFAIVSPQSKSQSPTNGFTSKEGSHLLQQELDELERKDDSFIGDSSLHLQLKDSLSIDCLTSPLDENISMFTRDNEVDTSSESDKKSSENNSERDKGEEWTLLDCQFGVPLFDVDANTKICDMIVSGGLIESESLEKLVESSRKLGTALLEFISQCQYYPGENMEIMKRGRLVPLPRHNLVFDNGKVTLWGGK